MKKTCEYCKTKFETKAKNRRFCSRSCATKQKCKNKGHKLKIVKIKKCEHCNSDFKTNNEKIRFCSKSCASKYLWTKDYYKKIHSQKSFSHSDESKLKIGKGNKNKIISDKTKKLQQNAANKIWESDKRRKIQSKAMLNKWNDCVFKEKMLKYFKSKEFSKMQSKSMLNTWSNPILADKLLKSAFKFKNYMLPSGQIIKVQGYEPYALDYLLTIFDESDIFTSVKKIHQQIGKIPYTFENKIHHYYPDIYVKSINTIFEVKSTYYYEKDKEKNLAKEQSCLKQGLNFEFLIFGQIKE